jgi:hypothetical protein
MFPETLTFHNHLILFYELVEAKGLDFTLPRCYINISLEKPMKRLQLL